jgi:hypothetical protein
MSDRRRIQFFGDYLNSLNRKSLAVEVGVHQGEYLFAMVNYCKQVKWFGVDPYSVYKSFSDRFIMPPQEEWNKVYAAICQKISTHSDRHRIKLIRKKAVDSLSDIPNDLDLVYIDGDHTYEAVAEDIKLWEPKVRPGGIIGGHDYNKSKDRYRKIFSGVIQAVDEYAAANNRLLLVNVPGNWYWIKS